MRILITGGAGFIGSVVVRKAVAQGCEVLNLDALTYAACLDNLADVASAANYQFSQTDIRDHASVADALSRFQPDTIMHLAAESHVDRSIDGPRAFVETNIMGTFNLLDAARQYWIGAGCPSDFRFHHVSTDEVFGSLGPTGRFHETSPYDPRSPYSASKASADHLVRAWHETFDLPVVLSNCSNNYGPFQFPEKLIPVTILNALAGKPIPIYGNGQNVRDWLFVEDHADALLLIAKHGQIGRSYTIGADEERSNIDLVHELCAILDDLRPDPSGSALRLITHVRDRPGHDERYAIDANRIRTELGWQPSLSLHDGLRRTVQWYLEHDDWWRALASRGGVGERLGLAS